MNTHPHFSAWLPFCVSLFLLSQWHTAAGGLFCLGAQGDTLTTGVGPQFVPKTDKPFKLLPKFSDRKDTVGFKLIPKHTDDPDVVPLDRAPQILRKAAPIYPKAAIQAGLEGNVIVKMLVDQEGKVQKAEVVRSDAEIFNEPAIEAAKQCVFAPASLNGKPVAVWISYPFHFRLSDEK